MSEPEMERITYLFRVALEDQRERATRLELRNAAWLVRFHRRYGGNV